MRLTLLLTCLCLASICLADESADRTILTDGVRRLTAPGAVAGDLAISGAGFAVLTGTSGSHTAVVFAGTRIGSGRVVAGGHGAYLEGSNLPLADNTRFLLNTIQWLSKKPVNESHVGLVEFDGMKSKLKGNGADVVSLRPRDLSAPIVGFDVLCVTEGALDADPAAQSAVLQFVKAGHGLLIAGPGWGWQQLHPNKSLFSDQSANRILSSYGITFTEGTIETDASTNDAANPLLKPDSAIEALTKGGLNPHDSALATDTIDSAIRLQTPYQHELLHRVKGLIDLSSGSLVPTGAHPVAATGLAKLAARIFEMENAAKAPEDVKAYPGASDFPGSIPSGTVRIAKSFSVNLQTPAWHGAGLYAAPGEVVQITIPADATALGLRVRIGSQTDSLMGNDSWSRFPDITMLVDLKQTTTKVASPFGGTIFIDVPAGLPTRSLLVTVIHAVEAPRFVRGRTTLAEWKALRNAPAPWAELEGNRVVLSVPSRVIRDLDDPEALMAYWDEVMDDVFAFYAAPPRPTRERYCVDRQISGGYMHSGYPIMTFEDVAKTFVTVSDLRSREGKVWGFYHEMGHNFQRDEWTFDGTGEVTNNLFSLYGNEKINGITPEDYTKAHGAMAPNEVKVRLKKYLDGGANFEKWKDDPFLALSMYAELRDGFGWEPFTKVFAGYWQSPASELPKSDLEKHDQWMVRFSRMIGKNLGPFFQAWGVPTSAAARQSIASLPTWMPPDWPKTVNL